MAFKDPSHCPGCGRTLGAKQTAIPVPTRPEEKVKRNGCWYCGKCGWELDRYSLKMILIPPVVCPGCARKILIPWKVAYADGRPCCADCQTKLFEAAQERKAREAQEAKQAMEKEKRKTERTPAAQADSPDRVTLISVPCSHGDTLLDTLILTKKDGAPAVQWCVSWRGGISHADGAGDTTPLPEELLTGLTPETLTGWLSQQSYGDLYDMTKFAADKRVEMWCGRMRTEPLTPEKRFDRNAAQHPEAAALKDRITFTENTASAASLPHGYPLPERSGLSIRTEPLTPEALFDRYAAQHPEAAALKDRITFTENTASAASLPLGYPLLERSGLSWSLTGSRDDMRGPQVRRNLSGEEAIALFIRLLRNPPVQHSAADKKAAAPAHSESKHRPASPALSGTWQAAAYSRIETDMRPGGVSQYAADAGHLMTLFHTASGPRGWGISNRVAVDDRSNVPYWVSTQYDGQIAAQTWYLEKKQLTFEEVRSYAREVSPEIFACVKDIASDNWRQCARLIAKAQNDRQPDRS